MDAYVQAQCLTGCFDVGSLEALYRAKTIGYIRHTEQCVFFCGSPKNLTAP